MTRVPEHPPIAADDRKLQASLVPVIGEHAREINRTLPEDQALAFTWFMTGHQETPVRFRGALVYRSTDLTISNGVITAVGWDMEVYDTDDIHDNSTNNSRLTVPDGVTFVRLTAGCQWKPNATGLRSLLFQKNGAFFRGGSRDNRVTLAAGSTHAQHATSAIVPTVNNDYFEAKVFQNSGGNLDIDTGNIVFFSMEIIRP